MTMVLFLFFFFPVFFGGEGGIINFDQKVRISIATKLFQFASGKEPYAILAGTDSFFWPSSHQHVRPLYGDFLSSFAMKVHEGPYRSYDK